MIVLAASLAEASSHFPMAAKEQLSLSRPPACTVCHEGTPGMGTATAPFGAALRRSGLAAGSTPSLTRALEAATGAGTDSDGDGRSDIDELKAGMNPNKADAQAVVAADAGVAPTTPVELEPSTLEPRYGCSATGGGGLTLALLSVLLALRARS
jgi:hypothetical protein